MDELAGRLAAVDPEASESLKVITYFDRLVAGGAGLESVARAAAVLAAVPSGVQAESGVIRVDVDGQRLPPITSEGALASSSSGGPRVWIERAGPAQANDAMIVERMAIAAATVVARRSTSAGALEQVIDPAVAPLARARAAGRLRLGQGVATVVSALPHSAGDPGRGPSAVVATSLGPLRIVIDRDQSGLVDGPMGRARAQHPEAIPGAWRDAQIALLQTDHRHPVVDAESFGVLIEIARRFDPLEPLHPDVAALQALGTHDLELLDVLVESSSMRAAARSTAMHHSSLQPRHNALRERLGYDPVEPRGRGRYIAARMISRLARPVVPE